MIITYTSFDRGVTPIKVNSSSVPSIGATVVFDSRHCGFYLSEEGYSSRCEFTWEAWVMYHDYSYDENGIEHIEVTYGPSQYFEDGKKL